MYHTPPPQELTGQFKGLSAQIMHGGLLTSERTNWRSQETGLIQPGKVCSAATRRTVRDGDVIMLDSAGIKGPEPGANTHSTKSDRNGKACNTLDACMRVCAL